MYSKNTADGLCSNINQCFMLPFLNETLINIAVILVKSTKQCVRRQIFLLAVKDPLYQRRIDSMSSFLATSGIAAVNEKSYSR